MIYIMLIICYNICRKNFKEVVSMIQLSYTTARLICRPLNALDYPVFADGVVQDQEVQKYFRIGSSYGKVCDFLDELPNTDCIPVGIFTKSTNQLLGYINGYAFCNDTLLVEFFVFEYYRSCRYITEALEEYFRQCISKCGIRNFRFEVEPDNIKSLAILQKFGARHAEEEDYKDSEREFLVYSLQI